MDRLWAALVAFLREFSWPRALWYLAAAAFATSALGVAAGNRWLLPALDVAAILPAWWWARRERSVQATAFILLFWAFWKAVALAFMTTLLPTRAAAAVAFGPRFADQTLTWLRTGELAPALGPWLVLKAAAAVFALSLVTGGIGGLVAAAVLLNCQAYVLGLLFTRTVAPVKVLALGWPLWYIFLALGLVNLLLAASEPLAGRMARRPFRPAETRDAFFVAVLMCVAAYLALTYLAPWYQEVLGPVVIFDPAALTGL